MNTVRTRKRFDIVNYIPLILGVIAVITVIVLISVSVAGRDKRVEEKVLELLPFKTDSTYVPFADGVVYIDDEKSEMYYVDDRNETMWGLSGTVEGMELYAGKSKVAVTVGKKLQVISLEGTLVFSKEFDKNISSVAVGEKLFAVSLSNSDDTIILNSNGEEIDRIISQVNNTNIRFGVYSDGSIWVITVENSGYMPEYQLSTYKYDTEKTQTVTFTDDSQMMYDAIFHDKLCYIFGTQKIMVRDCDYTGSVNRDYNVNGYDVVSYGVVDKNVHLLLMNGGKIKAIGEKGISDIFCDEKINYAVVANKKYYCFSNYFMYQIKPSKGKITKYRFPVRIDKVIQGGEYVLIESGENVYRYSLEV